MPCTASEMTLKLFTIARATQSRSASRVVRQSRGSVRMPSGACELAPELISIARAHPILQRSASQQKTSLISFIESYFWTKRFTQKVRNALRKTGPSSSLLRPLPVTTIILSKDSTSEVSCLRTFHNESATRMHAVESESSWRSQIGEFRMANRG